MGRTAILFAALAVAALLAGCDAYHSFYVRNTTSDSYFVRVTTPGRQGLTQRVGPRVFVYEVEPRESGYVARFVTSGFGGPRYTLEVLDANCAVLATWTMPHTGGQLTIEDDGAEFIGDQFVPLDTGPSAVEHPAATETPRVDREPFVSVMKCDATQLDTSRGAPSMARP